MSLRRTTVSLVAALAAGATGAGSAQAAFVPALESPYPTGAIAHALTTGDVDRNGTVDAAAGGLRLLRGDGTGRLSPNGSIGITGPVEAVAGGDLNGDSIGDYVAIAPESPRRVVMFTALSIGGYAQTTLLTDDDASDVAISNVNGDGLADVVVAEADPGDNVTVLLNLGGTFVEDSYPAGVPAPGDVEIGDMTGDGFPDIVVAGGGSAVATLVNERDGTFSDGAAYPAGTVGGARRLALTHVEGDGWLDVVATDSGGNPAVAVLRGIGTGALLPAGRQATALPAAATSIHSADVNGDGAADIVAGTTGGLFSLLVGDGAAGFSGAAGTPFSSGDPAGGTIDDIEAVDMNRDGQPDVVTANRPGSVSVLLNSATGLLQPLPGRVSFGKMPARSEPRTRTVSLRSVRGRLRITRVALQGARSFAVAGGDCVGRTLLLGQACTLAVTYAPARRAGRQEALVSVDANAAAVVLPLSAIPRAPLVTRPRLRPRKAAPRERLKLRYRLSEAARTRVLVQRAGRGRRVAGECVARKRRNSRRRACTRWTTLSTISRRGKLGANLLRLRARAKGRALAPGSYRLSVSATDRFRNRSDERFARLRVQAARRPK